MLSISTIQSIIKRVDYNKGKNKDRIKYCSIMDLVVFGNYCHVCKYYYNGFCRADRNIQHYLLK